MNIAHWSSQRCTHRVWMVVLGYVFAVFAPTVSLAIAAAASPVPAQMICGSGGALLQNSPAPSSPDDGEAMQSMHCAFCLQSSDRSAPPSEPLPYHFLVQDGHQVPSIWQALFYESSPVYSPPGRGPPESVRQL